MKKKFAKALADYRDGQIDFITLERTLAPDLDRFARHVYRFWPLPPAVSVEDLRQEMLIELWRALKKFEPGKGPTLRAYCVWCMIARARKYAMGQRGYPGRKAGDGKRQSRHMLCAAGLSTEEREFDPADRLVEDATQDDRIEARQAYEQRIRMMPDHAEAVGLVALVEAGGDVNEAAGEVFADPHTSTRLGLRNLGQARRLVGKVAAQFVETAA